MNWYLRFAKEACSKSVLLLLFKWHSQANCRQDAFFEVEMPDDWDDFEWEVELDIGPSIPGMNA